MIYSTKNHQLSQMNYYISLFEFDYVKPTFKAVIKKSKAASQSASTSSITLSIISNPSAAWTLISTIQLVSFLPLSKDPLPATMTQYCTELVLIIWYQTCLNYG